jgi:hypothetical protein
VIAFKGATAYEMQVGRLWAKFLRPAYWRTSGLRRLIHVGWERDE